MPLKAKKPCAKIGCPKLTNGGYCEEHKKLMENKYENERETASERGYNSQWAKVRVMKLHLNPICERCLLRGVTVGAYLVHHKDRNPNNNMEDNLESLCRDCHDAEHKTERWKMARSP